MQYKKFHLKRLYKELKTNSDFSDSSSNEYKYLNVVNQAINDSKVFENFRSNPGYRDILEHVSDSLATKYYENIRKQLTHLEIVEFCKVIKNIGNPPMVTINNTFFNPTSLRYLNVALDIRSKFSNNVFENIVEIGAGYGGQALMLENFFKIKNYTFIDLPEVNTLIEKFLKSHKVNFIPNFSTIEDLRGSSKFDLLISNYAFSELPKRIQLIAINKIINNSSNGYMIVNNFFKITFRYMSQKQYVKNIKNLEIHEEVPNSYIFNKLLIFKNLNLNSSYLY